MKPHTPKKKVSSEGAVGEAVMEADLGLSQPRENSGVHSGKGLGNPHELNVRGLFRFGTTPTSTA